MTLDEVLLQVEKAIVIKFLDEHYIDTDYYLNETSKMLIDNNHLSIADIDSMSSLDMFEYLDIDRLIKEECI